ncbi:hypothetical protein V2O64_04305 [Verrucomicrobiaceae bacterium 227]
MKFPLFLALGLLTHAAMATNMIEGTSTQFFGPDELLLDPATSIIAIDINGSSGPLVVNGVTFESDTAGPVTTNGVTVSTSATHAIDGWETAPDYTGIDSTSTDNLEQIMHDIRWSLAPSTVDVDISGLTPGTLYNVQLLFSENGSGSDRHWDIGAEGKLVVDDWTSLGASEDGGTSSPNHGYAYTGVFTPGADGILNLTMGQEPLPADPNNTETAGSDNNPILNAVIVHFNALPSPPDDISLAPNTFPASIAVGTTVGSLTSSDPNGGSHTYSFATGVGDSDNALFQISGDEIVTAGDFSALGGNTLSIRVRSTDEGGRTFEKALALTVTADSDNDLLEDSWELLYGTLTDFTGLVNGPGPGAGTGDFDGDGSPDLDEFTKGTNPTDDDSDDDGSSDGDEATAGTNPLDEDTDKDGLNDGDEAINFTDPLLPDSDGDTLLDGAEVAAGTDPTKKDSDDDGADDNLDPAPTDPNINSYTEIIVGDIIEFSGPDDLNLDPATAVIAVNSRGEFDVEVNGVTFLEDTTGNGTVTSDGVTVATTAVNQIVDWATTEYTGEDATSTDNLEMIMQSIRWSPAPEPVSIDISGLNPGASYQIQLLTNEGNITNTRQWDIAVEGELVVDNYTSSGRESVDVWTPNNGFAYVAEFEAPADGILNILMQQHFGGIEPRGRDGNPILQGIIVHETGPGTPFAITEIILDPDTERSRLTWNSRNGAAYILEYSTTMLEPWIEVQDGIASQGETTTFQDPIKRTGPVGFYRVKLAP